jgi:hypothetical protein
MDDTALDAVEFGVDRLIAAYGAMKSENQRLREQLTSMEARESVFRERLDKLIARIEGAATP